jgi:DNA repair exonuclease SbcCD nuclease subunit
LGKIGQIGLKVLMIPGNHDHGGTGSLWETREFVEQSQRLAPNLQVLLTAQPVEMEGTVVLPCPLLKRMETADTSIWIRQLPAETWATFGQSPRVMLAHGSVQAFGSAAIDGEAPNQIDLEQLPKGELDYVALGDWHGMKKVGPSAWYSGTPEIDRFPKGVGNRPGFCLVVTAHRGAESDVKEIPTSHKAWHQMRHEIHSSEELELLTVQFQEQFGSRVNQDLIELEITGSLGLDGQDRLEKMLAMIRPSLIALDVRDRMTITPTDQEIESLTLRATDPLISTVARRLLERYREDSGKNSAVALSALRELHAMACRA